VRVEDSVRGGVADERLKAPTWEAATKPSDDDNIAADHERSRCGNGGQAVRRVTATTALFGEDVIRYCEFSIEFVCIHRSSTSVTKAVPCLYSRRAYRGGRKLYKEEQTSELEEQETKTIPLPLVIRTNTTHLYRSFLRGLA